MPAHHRFHPYTIQTIAFFVSMIPFLMLTSLMLGAAFFEGRRRAKKPALRRAFLRVPVTE